MPNFTITTHNTAQTLFSGTFETLRQCVEQAAADNVSLDHADLRHANLVNACLDNAQMRHARLDGANLMGANLSEAALDQTAFTNAGLQNACLCYAALHGCDFDGALFGATDAAGVQMTGARFSTLSAFSLNFRDIEKLGDCRYINPDGTACPFSRPPLAVQGLAWPVILMDEHLKIGSAAKPFAAWQAAPASGAAGPAPFEDAAHYAFFRQHAPLLQALIAERTHSPSARNCRVACGSSQ